MGMNFGESVRGARFYDHHVPALIKGINRLAAAIEDANQLQREAMAAADKSDAVPKSENEAAFT